MNVRGQFQGLEDEELALDVWHRRNGLAEIR